MLGKEPKVAGGSLGESLAPLRCTIQTTSFAGLQPCVLRASFWHSLLVVQLDTSLLAFHFPVNLQPSMPAWSAASLASVSRAWMLSVMVPQFAELTALMSG